MRSTRWILNTTRPKQQGRVPVAIDGVSIDAEHLGLEKKHARAPSKIGIGRLGKWQYLFSTYVISYIYKYLSADKLRNGKGTTWKRIFYTDYQISCTRTLVVSHWPEMPGWFPAPNQSRILLQIIFIVLWWNHGYAKVTKVKIFTGHLLFFFRWMLPLWDRPSFFRFGDLLYLGKRHLER